MRWIERLFASKRTPAKSLAEPASPAKPALTPQAWLVELFRNHGLDASVRNGWVLPNATLPAIRGHWHPGETHGRLDMEVLVRDGVTIWENFAGIGAGDAGLADGLQNFTINSFHVLASALWRSHDPEQVETEAWTIAGRPFKAFIGNIGTRSSTPSTPPLPERLMSALEAAIQREPLENDLHWFRFYVGHVTGEFTIEALKDNEAWPAGETALASCGWPANEAFYSARLFMVLRSPAEAG